MEFWVRGLFQEDQCCHWLTLRGKYAEILRDIHAFHIRAATYSTLGVPFWNKIIRLQWWKIQEQHAPWINKKIKIKIKIWQSTLGKAGEQHTQQAKNIQNQIFGGDFWEEALEFFKKGKGTQPHSVRVFTSYTELHHWYILGFPRLLLWGHSPCTLQP